MNSVNAGVGTAPYDHARAVADKQYAAQQQGAEQAKGGTAPREPLLHRVIRLYQQSSGDLERIGRIHALLVKHPEFEEFLELQDLLQLQMIRR